MKQIVTLLFLIGFSLFLGGCADFLGGDEIAHEYGPNISVEFCQVDNCSQTLENLILSAEISVYAAFYDLDLENVVSAMDEQNNRGLDVRVVVDNQYYDDLSEYEFIRHDDSSQYSHNKFLVVDGKLVWMGSMNPTNNGAYLNDNNALFIYSKTLADNYMCEFDELWSGVFGDGFQVKNPVVYYNDIQIENYFCPEDFCADSIVNVLKSANKSIYFMTFSFTHDEIGDAISAFPGQKGGVFENFQKKVKGSEYEKLKDFSVIDKNPKMMHHKVFIVDEEIVITGSMNPTASGNDRNDENILIIYDETIASMYYQEYLRVSGK